MNNVVNLLDSPVAIIIYGVFLELTVVLTVMVLGERGERRGALASLFLTIWVIMTLVGLYHILKGLMHDPAMFGYAGLWVITTAITAPLITYDRHKNPAKYADVVEKAKRFNDDLK